MESNLKLMSENMHFFRALLAHLTIVAKGINQFLSDIRLMVKYWIKIYTFVT